MQKLYVLRLNSGKVMWGPNESPPDLRLKFRNVTSFVDLATFVNYKCGCFLKPGSHLWNNNDRKHKKLT